MTLLSALAILAAGVAAGTVNVMVGSGSLITFPTLLALGYAPVLANVSNTVGLVPGSASGVIAYRKEMRGQGPRLVRLGAASLLGGLTGAILLLILPHSVFKQVVPLLIVMAALLMAVQPRLSRRLAAQDRSARDGGPLLYVLVYLAGIYGGYFGAAQGVILIALLATFLDDDLQRLNGAKNALAMLVNGVAGIFFICTTHVSWPVIGLIAVGSIIGGQIGGIVGRRLPAPILRAVIVLVGLAVAAVLIAEWH